MSITSIEPIQLSGHTPGKVFRAMIEVKRRLKAVGKGGKVDGREFGNYEYRKFEDVINAIAPLLDDAGLITVATVISKEERQDQKKHFVTLTMQFRLYAEDGSYVEASHIGEAFDVGDKAATKAQTVALRIFYCTTFNIPFEEMQDPESGPQHGWAERKPTTKARLITALDSLQDAKRFSGFLRRAIALLDHTDDNGDGLTKQELSDLKEVFTANARRLRFSENIVARIVSDIDNALNGNRPSQSAVEIAPEPVKIRELKLDFATSKDKAKVVQTAVQSFRSGFISRDELAELCAESCPEDGSAGPEVYFLGAIEQCASVEELAQASAAVQQAVQSKKISQQTGVALANLVQYLIDSNAKGASDGDE